MNGEVASLLGGSVEVRTTSNRGFTPEELTDMALDKIIYVGNDAHPAITDQARAYRARIRMVLLHYMKEAVRSHNTTLINRLVEAGHRELLPILEP